MARVIPLYKNGQQNIPGNYRPISVLPAISKIIERILYDQLYNYLTKFELLSDSHWPLMISPAFDDKPTDNSLFLEIQFWMVGAVINILIKLTRTSHQKYTCKRYNIRCDRKSLPQYYTFSAKLVLIEASFWASQLERQVIMIATI